MKIVFLDFDDIKNPLLGAGQARATYEVGFRLAQKGNSVVSLCAKYPGYRDRIEHGIEYRHIGLSTPYIKLNNFLYFFTIPFAVARLQADIIVECFTAPISTLFSPLFTKIPVVALPTVFSADHFSKKYHIPLTWIEALGCRLYRYFMPYIEEDEKKMRSYNPTIISRMIPQGVGDEYFRVKQRAPAYILYLGRIDIAQKGIDLLLRAYAKVADTIGMPLVIAGHGPDEESLQQLIKTLQLENSVTFVGPAYGKTKMKLLSGAHVVAFPSRYDNLPLFSLEALASGLPLVAFSTKEFSWLRPEFSYTAPPFDIDAYGKALLLAVTSDKTKQKKITARNYAKHFTWDTVATQMNKFFTEIIIKEKNI